MTLDDSNWNDLENDVNSNYSPEDNDKNFNESRKHVQDIGKSAKEKKGQALTNTRKEAARAMKTEHEGRKILAGAEKALGKSRKSRAALMLARGAAGIASGGTVLVAALAAEFIYKHKKIFIGAVLILLTVFITYIFVFVSIILCVKKFVGNNPISAIKNVVSAIIGNKSCDNPADAANADANAITVTKTGPEAVVNPDGKGPDVKYTITIGFTGQAQDITITDTLLTPNATFISASGKHTTDPPGDGPNTKSITWSAAANSASQSAGTGGETFTSTGTGYYPANNQLEGGFNDMQGKPLHTLQDYLSGKVKDYVSVAMDKGIFPYGTELTIKELDQKYGKHIPFHVVDTGGAFTGKGKTRIDICTQNQAASTEKTINGPLTITVGSAAAGGASFNNMSFTVVFRPKDKDSYVINKATATVMGVGTGGDTPATPGTNGYVAPNANTCNGKYSAGVINKSPLKKNFGDPSCDFSKDKLFALLKAKDAANATRWYNKIIPCESGYSPNAYAGPQTGTPDAAGAWGLFQMGSSKPPGSAPPAAGKNGVNDRGDVPWSIQVENATTYGKKIKSLGAYWACAR